jgi:ribulose 1,5-bisphosphate synthetase/thiazole synthase
LTLKARIVQSQRSKIIFRSASSFEEVLVRQQAESHKDDLTAPREDEADHFFVVKETEDVNSIIQRIINIAADIEH